MLVLVVGSSGMLGTDIVKALSHNGISHLAFNKNDLNIEDEFSLQKILRAHRVTHIINCAAYTNVPQAEKEIDVALKINSVALKNISIACNQHKVKLIHFSTDYVFNGCKKGKYKESDGPDPVNVYGRSKLRGEEEIGAHCDDYKIFRLQWLYGKSGRNFIDKIISQYKDNGRVEVVNDQFGSPCSAEFIANTIMTILERWDYGKPGVYHLTHDDCCSWYDFARHIFKKFDIESQVTSISSKSYKARVARPDNCTMDNSKIINTFKLENLGSWKYDFDNYFSHSFDLQTMNLNKKLKLSL